MIDELGALRRIRERFRNVSKGVSLGIGDDASAVRIHPEKDLLATTDSQVENVHFIKGLISAKLLGRRSVAVAVSDIGAMGGVPKFFLASVGFSEEEDDSSLEGLMDGFQAAEKEFGLELIGGNLSASERMFIDITVLGEIEPHLLVKRSGAKSGDFIYVSGTLGDSALGLRLVQKGEENKNDEFLTARHRAPKPRLKLGRELAERRLATAMIDISDGFVLDLERITLDQGLGAEISVDRLPLSSDYKKRVSDFTRDKLQMALSGGEDYELLFTCPREKAHEIKEISNILDIPITEVGRVAPNPYIKLLDSDGKEIKIERRGFIHFTTG